MGPARITPAKRIVFSILVIFRAARVPGSVLVQGYCTVGFDV